jgi:Desulfoferrodoxin, N-terminal domain
VSVIKPGVRFRCAQCGTETVVVKADGAVPSCCGEEMANLSSQAAVRASEGG